MNEDLPERQSISGMARELGMSRQRLHQLLGTTFPLPSQDEDGTKFFSREQQQRIFDCYRNNRGVDGRTVFFRPRKKSLPKEQGGKSQPKSTARRSAPSSSQKHRDLLKTIRSMGLTQAKVSDLKEVLDDLYPKGVVNVTPDVIKSVFLRLHSRFSE